MFTAHRLSWFTNTARLLCFACAIALGIGASLPAEAQDRRWTTPSPEAAASDLYAPENDGGVVPQELPNRPRGRFILVKPFQRVVINRGGETAVRTYTPEPSPENVPSPGEMTPEEIRQLIGFVPEFPSREARRPSFREERFGTPNRDRAYWQRQTTSFTCAVQAQRGIIEEFTGAPVTEAQLVREAVAHGWMSEEGGTPAANVGNLLKLHGIDCHAGREATIENLIEELTQGHKVIVGVNAGKLWRQNSTADETLPAPANHAIWVTGVERLPSSGELIVYVNDSGEAQGAGKAYALSRFMSAWKSSGFHYVATDDAPPAPRASRYAPLSRWNVPEVGAWSGS